MTPRRANLPPMTNRNAELLVATSNRGKIEELKELLEGTTLSLRFLKEYPGVSEAEETGSTFIENATLKAKHYALHTRTFTLADDSGLEVDALGKAPGVYSARYVSPSASYEERMGRILSELEMSGDDERRARFVCVIALCDPETDEVRTFTGVCEGSIASSARGTNGFGYDPIFVPEGYRETFGELSSDVKQRLSHRARALEQASRYLRDKFSY